MNAVLLSQLLVLEVHVLQKNNNLNNQKFKSRKIAEHKKSKAENFCKECLLHLKKNQMGITVEYAALTNLDVPPITSAHRTDRHKIES